MTTVRPAIAGVVADRLLAYASRQGVSLDQAARELIDFALAASEERERVKSGRPAKLTYGGLAIG